MAGKKTEKVYQWLLEYIEEYKFSSNLKLPSENAVRARLHVGRETVRSALEQLEREELIYKVRGSGTYIRKETALSRNFDTGSAGCKIGLILQGQDSSANSKLIDGIADGLKKISPDKEVDLNIFLTDNRYANERRCLQAVMEQNYQGFIIDGVKASLMNPNLDCYKEIYDRGIPVIFYNNYYKEVPYPKVIVNDLKCADALVMELIRAGHRNIAGIFLCDNYQSVEKFHGMIRTMRRSGLELKDEYIKWCVSDDTHDERFVKSIEQFLRGIPACTAIICCNYIIYCYDKKALIKNAKKVPDDYSVVCFDYSGEDWVEEGITCSISQGYLTGVRLAENLMKMIDRKECSGARYSCMMDSDIYIGRSVKNIKD